jgi:hypothetical protein
MVASCAESEGLELAERRAKKPRTRGAGLRVLGGNYETRRRLGPPRIGVVRLTAIRRFDSGTFVPAL